MKGMGKAFLVALALPLTLTAQEIQLEQVAGGLSTPTDIQNARDGSGRLFFVQQNGVISVLRSGGVLPQPFLDIRNKTRANGEQGLLGMAFPPGFAQKQRFYVNYTDLQGNTVIAQYRVSANPDQADSTSENVLLYITQPFPNHNGGQLRFGPDGYLYIGMGDGGSGGDPQNNGQSFGTLLGKMLRIDVESTPGQVTIPADNPFKNRPGARPEIWAFGLRNPWRFSFDRSTGDLWIADVGQNTYEEVNFQPSASHGGENYGWNLMEGFHCYQPGCNPQGLTLPVTEYSHADGCSISGGFVYRGAISPGLRGTYVYGDYCSGNIWGLERQGSAWNSRLLLAAGFNITTFGEDESGELYVANASNGSILHIVGSRAPRFVSTSVVNAASYRNGLVAGSLASVFAMGVLSEPSIVTAGQVPLPLNLRDVSINVDEFSAPILALANASGLEQVNFQVPFEVVGRGSVSVVVKHGNDASAGIAVPLFDLQPAIYSIDTKQAIVLHGADNSVVTPANPLRRGESAVLFAAGLGRVTNQPATGAASLPSATTLSTATLTLGGKPCAVQFSGLMRGAVGLYQVNWSVPANAASGSQELVLNTDGVLSPVVSVFAE